jgi:hypothetical protein
MCTDLFGRQLQRIFETHCIRHFTLQYEYIAPGGNMNRCAYGSRRRHRGHQSCSDDNGNAVQAHIDIRAGTGSYRADQITFSATQEEV